MTVGRLVAHALDLAFPAACVGCGREGRPLCEACEPALDARLRSPPGVAIGLPATIPAPLLQLEWCAPFRGPVRAALHALKYDGEQRLAEPLGAAVARRWRAAGAGGTLIAHVPVHAERARRRGYDQAERIARVAARELGMPHASPIVRARATTAQFDLDREARATNVHDAFAARDPAAAAVVRNAWVVLVDDVVTTGATLAACGATLVRMGALAVSAITLAREA